LLLSRYDSEVDLAARLIPPPADSSGGARARARDPFITFIVRVKKYGAISDTKVARGFRRYRAAFGKRIAREGWSKVARAREGEFIM